VLGHLKTVLILVLGFTVFHVRYFLFFSFCFCFCSFYALFAATIAVFQSQPQECLYTFFLLIFTLFCSIFFLSETCGHAQHSGHWNRHGRVSSILYHEFLDFCYHFSLFCCGCTWTKCRALVCTFILKCDLFFPLFCSVVAYTEVRRREASPGGLPSAVSTDRLSSSKV